MFERNHVREPSKRLIAFGPCLDRPCNAYLGAFGLLCLLDYCWGLDLATFQIFQSLATLVYVSTTTYPVFGNNEHS